MTTSRLSKGAMNQRPDEIVAQANDAYWNSGASVNRLAKDFDLSKGALYDIIAALPAGLPCPHGDGELVYTNRTARERGFVSCATCGFADEEVHVRARLEETGSAPAPPGAGRSLETLLVVTALAGLAAGLFISGVLRRSGDT